MPTTLSDKHLQGFLGADEYVGIAPAVKAALLQATEPGGRLYAMDWYHCAFLYDPRKEEEQKRVKLEDGDGKYRGRERKKRGKCRRQCR